jgi:hypothetical protein
MTVWLENSEEWNQDGEHLVTIERIRNYTDYEVLGLATCANFSVWISLNNTGSTADLLG